MQNHVLFNGLQLMFGYVDYEAFYEQMSKINPKFRNFTYTVYALNNFQYK